MIPKGWAEWFPSNDLEPRLRIVHPDDKSRDDEKPDPVLGGSPEESRD